MGEMTFSSLKKLTCHSHSFCLSWVLSPSGDMCSGHLSLLSNWTAVLRLTGTDYVAFEQLYLLGKQISTKQWRWYILSSCLLTSHRTKSRWYEVFCYLWHKVPFSSTAMGQRQKHHPSTPSKDYLDHPNNGHGHPEVWTCEKLFPLKKDKNTDRHKKEKVCHNTACHNIYSQVKMLVCPRPVNDEKNKGWKHYNQMYLIPSFHRSNLESLRNTYCIQIQTRYRQLLTLPAKANLFCN